MKKVVKNSERIYGFILRLYPKSYTTEFGEEMKYVFLESLKDTYKQNNELGIVSFWIRTLTDVTKSLVIQHIENQKGGEIMKKTTNSIIQNKDIAMVFGVTAGILSIPLIAMQFTSEVTWNLIDFVSMGILISGTGLLVALAARKIKKTSHRVAVIAVLIAALFILWVHLSVGIVDAWPLAGS